MAFSTNPADIISVHRVATGDRVSSLKGHTDLVCAIAFDRSPVLASLSDDTTIRIWNINTTQCLQIIKYRGRIYSHLLFCADGRRLRTDVGYFGIASEVQGVMRASKIDMERLDNVDSYKEGSIAERVRT